MPPRPALPEADVILSVELVGAHVEALRGQIAALHPGPAPAPAPAPAAREEPPPAKLTATEQCLAGRNPKTPTPRTLDASAENCALRAEISRLEKLIADRNSEYKAKMAEIESKEAEVAESRKAYDESVALLAERTRERDALASIHGQLKADADSLNRRVAEQVAQLGFVIPPKEERDNATVKCAAAKAAN
jgi:hypothetical protein